MTKQSLDMNGLQELFCSHAPSTAWPTVTSVPSLQSYGTEELKQATARCKRARLYAVLFGILGKSCPIRMSNGVLYFCVFVLFCFEFHVV